MNTRPTDPPALAPTSQLAGGRYGSELARTAPGSMGAAASGPPLPLDSLPEPYPKGAPLRPGEHGSAPDRSAMFGPVREASAGWLPVPSGQAK